MWAAPLLLPFTTREGCRGCQEALVPLPGFYVPFPCGEGASLLGGEGEALGDLGLDLALAAPAQLQGLGMSHSSGLGWSLHSHRGLKQHLPTEHKRPGAWQQGDSPQPSSVPCQGL